MAHPHRSWQAFLKGHILGSKFGSTLGDNIQTDPDCSCMCLFMCAVVFLSVSLFFYYVFLLFLLVEEHVACAATIGRPFRIGSMYL